MRGPAAAIVGVAAAPVVDAELGGGAGVLHQPFEQADLRVLLLGEPMAELVRDGQGAQRAHGVDEQRMGAVERVDVAAGRDARPAPRLDGAADLQRELVEAPLPVGRVVAAFAGEAPQRAVRADVVEAVIVDADVGQVRRHPLDGARAAELEELACRRWRRTAAAPSRTGSPASIPSSRGRASGPRR